MSMKAYITAIASYLPAKVEKNDPVTRLTKKTKIYERHIAGVEECASDLAFQAAEKLFADSGLRKGIDFVILCTQSPDYFLPTTACILQNRLGLSNRCGAFDFNLGCSGYVYGLSIAKGLVETRQASNVLLLTAETYSKFIHPEDGTVKPLFGDGATATLISAKESQKDGIGAFSFGTNGSGAEYLIVPAGAAREPAISTPLIEKCDDGINRRTNYNLSMNGSEITNFALEVVPQTVMDILMCSGLDKSEIDYYIFHQANKFMLEFLQQKCDLQGLPFWNAPESCGNTVSSSIPLAITQMLKGERPSKLENVMLVGFGVGLSWSGCLVDLSYI